MKFARGVSEANFVPPFTPQTTFRTGSSSLLRTQGARGDPPPLARNRDPPVGPFGDAGGVLPRLTRGPTPRSGRRTRRDHGDPRRHRRGREKGAEKPKGHPRLRRETSGLLLSRRGKFLRQIPSSHPSAFRLTDSRKKLFQNRETGFDQPHRLSRLAAFKTGPLSSPTTLKDGSFNDPS